jgi:hypothetical protein
METAIAAVLGLIVGALLATFVAASRARRLRHQKLEVETRIRRTVVPVLERRADALAIPPAARGSNGDGPIVIAVSLAQSIQALEESGELPFGDTVEVARKELDAKLRARKEQA